MYTDSRYCVIDPSPHVGWCAAPCRFLTPTTTGLPRKRQVTKISPKKGAGAVDGSVTAMTDAAGAPADPLPPVERLRPGLTSVPVPLPHNSLRYVFVFVFDSDQGVHLGDAGWDTDEAYAALDAGLATAGYGMADVRGVMVTHIHPDHYGLAGRVREASGAWISLHPADARLIQDRYIEPADLIDRVGAMLRRMGAPPDEVSALSDRKST